MGEWFYMLEEFVKGRVSIIIPVYNGSNYVCDAVDSAISQTYGDVEVIVVNDGSDDDGETRKCLLQYGSRIKYIEKENGGVASALNEGVHSMSGEYFAWLSHDDVFQTDKIEKQINALQEGFYQDGICSSNYAFFDDASGEEIQTEFDKFFSKEKLEESIFLLLWGELHFSSLLIHRKHFSRIGFFNESLLTAQDNEFLIRLLRKQKVCFCSDSLSRVRLHADAGTMKNRNRVFEENARVYGRLLESLQEGELWNIGVDDVCLKNKISAIIHSFDLDVCEKTETNAVDDNFNGRIILIGAGNYGRRINYEMRKRGWNPVCFFDSDVSKAGRFIDGTKCYLLDQEKVKEEVKNKDAQIIITSKFYPPLARIISSWGISEYMTKQDFERWFLSSEEG